MKKALLPVLLLALLLCFTACNSNTLDPVISTTPSADAGEATPGADGTAAPTPTVAPVAEPDYAVVEISDAGFDELYNQSTYVLLGTVEDDGVEWNSCRAPGDASKPNETVFEMDMSFKFTIVECLKGDLKAGDTIQYNVHYRDKYPGEDDYTVDANYLAPVKGNTYLIFVEPDPEEELKQYCYPGIEPHCFELKDDTLYIYTNREIKDTWADGQGVEGVKYASAKLEMGIEDAAE